MPFVAEADSTIRDLYGRGRASLPHPVGAALAAIFYRSRLKPLLRLMPFAA